MKHFISLTILAAIASQASAQSLYLRKPEVKLDDAGKPDSAANLREVSFLFVEPPTPRKFALHDLVTIVVDETSRESSKQKLDTKKDYEISAELSKFPSLEAFLDGQLAGRTLSPKPEVGLDANNKFKGEGTYDRSDRFNARITAKVIDVKPNGTLVIEARKEIKKNEEATVLVLSGECRTDDITNANTVLSSQLAELTITSKADGQVKDSATKGWIPRLFEAIFAF